MWKIFEFYEHLIIKEEDFPYIIQHAIKFNVYNISYCTYTGHLYSFDNYCVTKLSISKQLTWLNLTGTPISITCFLQLLPNLEILDLSQCPNLNDNDFHAVSVCHKLENLHLSFNDLDPKTVTGIVSCTPTLQVLDICGIQLKYIDFISILDKCML